MNDELRTERRVSAEAIPEDLRELNYSAGFFHERRAELANISKGGISFFTDDVATNYEVGQKLKLTFFSRKIKISGRVVYVNHISEEKLKIGMVLLPSAELNEIKEIIDEV